MSHEHETAHRPTGKPTTALPQDSNANQHGLKYYAPLGPLHAATFHSLPPQGVSTALLTNSPLLIIDSGVSVCITPHRSDFISYQKSSMKIKDLSSSNIVAGEGLLQWNIADVAGRTVTLELPGYHVPGAEVRLLSPQVLLSIFGGHTMQTTQRVEVCLENGLILHAHLCPRSRLPLLPFVPSDMPTSFWCDAFAYSSADVAKIKSVLHSANQNLSGSQKELLLWHQHLSHANLAWIQTLMRDRKWLQDTSTASSFHSGPFIPSTLRAPVCDVRGLECSACFCAKGTTHTLKKYIKASSACEDKCIETVSSSPWQFHIGGSLHVIRYGLSTTHIWQRTGWILLWHSLC